MKKTIYICILFFGVVAASQAQTDPFFLQQSQNRMLINPAATGKGGDINSALLYRAQWIGFPGPITQSLYTNGFVKNLRSGIGLMWINDKFGPQQTNNIKLNYSYFVPFDEIAFFSLGLGVGVMNNTYNELEYFARDLDDLVLMDLRKQNKTIPDFDFGFEFNMPQLEVGASISHITYMYGDQSLVRPMRNIYAYSRVKLLLNKYWDFIPGITWHNNRKLNTCEILAEFRYNNNLCVHLVYRNPLDCGIMLGFNVVDGFRVAYSYDYGFDNLSRYNTGSHEFSILYNIPVNTTHMKTLLRFFRWKMF